MKQTLSLLCLLVTLWASLATPSFAEQAPAPADALITALAGMQRLAGDFEQRQYESDGSLIAESSGRFKLLRPGFFLWEISSPDSQVVIANPQYLWHYDRDLETVTRRPVTAEGGTAPLQILGGDAEALRRDFRVSQHGPGVFFLEAQSANAGFEALTLTLAEGRPAQMDIRDNLKQRIVIDFMKLDGQAALTPQDFEFQPPPGVDLFYYDE
ncbi:MAG: outer-membrane lipoprotein carrier protein LolA [Halioglobus sp.]|nr:outer-membrane lipoprotein carrier protein LolA [Halioglobus sp.]